jgi:hypothetical protein
MQVAESHCTGTTTRIISLLRLRARNVFHAGITPADEGVYQMKFEESTFARAAEARMLAVQGEQEIARAIVAFFVGLFTRKAAAAKSKRDPLSKMVVH